MWITTQLRDSFNNKSLFPQGNASLKAKSSSSALSSSYSDSTHSKFSAISVNLLAVVWFDLGSLYSCNASSAYITSLSGVLFQLYFLLLEKNMLIFLIKFSLIS